MSELRTAENTHHVEGLPDVDQQMIKRGLCPWCVVPLVDATLYGREGDECPDCADTFIGALTVED